jgi:hypothetical protein
MWQVKDEGKTWEFGSRGGSRVSPSYPDGQSNPSRQSKWQILFPKDSGRMGTIGLVGSSWLCVGDY